ncbi:MAG: HEAT repeat domain-containing protein [Planctomycetales bacterium]
MSDQAFEALAKYDWGKDRNALKPIDQAVIDTHGDAAARKQLETRLAALLETDASRAAKDYVCRALRVVGTAVSVPLLAKLLPLADHSHMARYALERIPAPQAGQAMREALPKLSNELKVGVISSLGARQDDASSATLGKLVGDADAAVGRSAAFALGAIRSPEAAKALSGAKAKQPQVKAAIADASLSCAESLLAGGKKSEALKLYKGLSGKEQPKHVRLAATRGVLACAGK